MTPETRSQMHACAVLIDRALVLDSPPGVGEPEGPSEAQATAAAVIVDPLLEATNQGTCSAALASGDPNQVAAAAGRAYAQVLQIDLGGERPPADLARAAFEAYGEAAGWRTFDGRSMPRWDELVYLPHGMETRRRWEAAVAAVRGPIG